MADQADGLRQLLQVRPDPERVLDPVSSERPCILAFTSGKGGVGTSNLVLNLAIALGEAGRRVVVIDADWGLASLDMLCGLSPSRSLSDVLADRCPLAEAVTPGPAGIGLVVGVHALRVPPEALLSASARLAAGLHNLADSEDFVLIDAGHGLGQDAVTLAEEVDEVVVVTTPEPTAIADSHAVLARVGSSKPDRSGPRLRVVVNQARSHREGRECSERIEIVSREFFGLAVTSMGHVRADSRVSLAVRRRRPFLADAPRSPAARDVHRLAQTLIEERRPEDVVARSRLITSLAAHWSRRAACW